MVKFYHEDCDQKSGMIKQTKLFKIKSVLTRGWGLTRKRPKNLARHALRGSVRE